MFVASIAFCQSRKGEEMEGQSFLEKVGCAVLFTAIAIGITAADSICDFVFKLIVG